MILEYSQNIGRCFIGSSRDRKTCKPTKFACETTLDLTGSKQKTMVILRGAQYFHADEPRTPVLRSQQSVSSWRSQICKLPNIPYKEWGNYTVGRNSMSNYFFESRLSDDNNNKMQLPLAQTERNPCSNARFTPILVSREEKNLGCIKISAGTLGVKEYIERRNICLNVEL